MTRRVVMVIPPWQGGIRGRLRRQTVLSVREGRSERGREVLVSERGPASLALDLGLPHFVADEAITLGAAQQSRHGDAGDSVDGRFHVTMAVSGSASTCRSAREFPSLVARASVIPSYTTRAASDQAGSKGIP